MVVDLETWLLFGTAITSAEVCEKVEIFYVPKKPARVGDRFPGDEFAPSTVTSVAGYPQITVPMGMYKGLPIGISFFARAWSEPKLIALAYAYEQATKHRQPPTFAPTVRLD